jgi:UDP-N-acetylmuramate dehydrogenase
VDQDDLLQDKLGNNVRRDVILAPFTTFRIGGPAKYFYEATNPQQLLAAYDTAVTEGLKFFVLGGGSNILFADEGFDGFIIRDASHEIVVDGIEISAQSGVRLDKLVDIAANNSLAGLEFAAGIPGNVGGAIFGNAGAFGGSMADVLQSVVIYNPRAGIRIVESSYFDFAYRHSRLKAEHELLISAKLKLTSGDKTEITDKINTHRQLRRAKHPVDEGSAGSVFKNIKYPELKPAGKLLEDSGVRGMKVGGAEIFERHCNIIINKGQARAADVRQLASMMRQKVIDKFGIELEYEITIMEP